VDDLFSIDDAFLNGPRAADAETTTEDDDMLGSFSVSARCAVEFNRA
jgi:hypothetical protein